MQGGPFHHSSCAKETAVTVVSISRQFLLKMRRLCLLGKAVTERHELCPYLL